MKVLAQDWNDFCLKCLGELTYKTMWIKCFVGRFLLLIQFNGYKIMEIKKISLWVSFGSYIFLGIYSINLKF